MAWVRWGLGCNYDGFCDYRARYYDPSIGRFLSEDPIQFAGSGTNFYSYVANSATNALDPMGRAILAVGDVHSVEQALAYLHKDPRMAAIIDDAARPEGPDILIVTNSHGIDTTLTEGYFWAHGGYILWDPHMGIGCDDSGGAQMSPAMALGHELIHTSHSNLKRLFRNLFPVADYDSLEEQVTVNLENEVAGFLGEGVRLNHHGKPVRVKSPTAKPVNCGCKQGQMAPES